MNIALHSYCHYCKQVLFSLVRFEVCSPELMSMVLQTTEPLINIFAGGP